MDDDDEFEREAALDAEDAAWENSDDDAPEEAPNGSDDEDDDDAPEEAGNAPRTVDEDGFSDEEPDAAANAAAVDTTSPRARAGARARCAREAAAAKRRKLAEPAADFVEVPAEPVVAAPPPVVERRTRVADNIFVSDERAHRACSTRGRARRCRRANQILRLLDGVAVAPSTHWLLRAQVGARARAARGAAPREHDGPRPVRDASAAGLRGPQAPAAEGQGEGGGAAPARPSTGAGASARAAENPRRSERRGPKAAGAPQVQRGGPGAPPPQERGGERRRRRPQRGRVARARCRDGGGAHAAAAQEQQRRDAGATEASRAAQEQRSAAAGGEDAPPPEDRHVLPGGLN